MTLAIVERRDDHMGPCGQRIARKTQRERRRTQGITQHVQQRTRRGLAGCHHGELLEHRQVFIGQSLWQWLSREGIHTVQVYTGACRHSGARLLL